MNILIDIGHPAHVHYFRNFIRIMESRGHRFLVTSRKKEIAFQLLNAYGIPYHSRGIGPKGLVSKFLNMFRADFRIWRLARPFQPDLFMSFGAPYAAQVAALMGKPAAVLDDTEHADFQRKTYLPFAKVVLTPTCFWKDIGPKQLRFDGYMELCYLHPKYFTPDPAVLTALGVEPGEKFTIFRFVSWEAHHDVGHRGLTNEAKIRIVQACAEFGKVFISSEMALPEELKPYQLQLPVDQVHHAMAFASLLYGESATMASECAVLGTPAIFLDDTGRGYNKEQEEKYGLVSNFTNAPEDQERSLKRALEILRLPDPKAEWMRKRDRMLADKLDVTAFLVWFAEAYPESIAAARGEDSLKERFSARPAGRE